MTISETSIIVTVVIVILFLAATGAAWYLLIYIPRNVRAVVTEAARTIKDDFGFTPQVTVGRTVFFKQTREILELALLEHNFEVEEKYRDRRLLSEKQIWLQGKYRAKVGFDLTKGFRVKIHRDQMLGARKLTIHLPHAEVLSIQDVDIQKVEKSGLINWVNQKDREEAEVRLRQLAQSQGVKSEILAEAESRLENRLSESLLPKLKSYTLEYSVHFFEGRIKPEVITLDGRSAVEVQSEAGQPDEVATEPEAEPPAPQDGPAEIIRFDDPAGSYGCFSNYARYPITIKGKEWPTSEHYFQAQKFSGKPLEETIRLAKTSRIATEIGRHPHNKIRADWKRVRDSVMREAVRAKFVQHPELAEILRSTGSARLVAHTLHDSYWGDGGDDQGQNMLGEILMEVRQQLLLVNS